MTAPLLYWLLTPVPGQREPHVPSRTARPVEHHDGRGEIVGVAWGAGAGTATHRPPTAVELERSGNYGRALAAREAQLAAEDELLLLGLL